MKKSRVMNDFGHWSGAYVQDGGGTTKRVLMPWSARGRQRGNASPQRRSILSIPYLTARCNVDGLESHGPAL